MAPGKCSPGSFAGLWGYDICLYPGGRVCSFLVRMQKGRGGESKFTPFIGSEFKYGVISLYPPGLLVELG